MDVKKGKIQRNRTLAVLSCAFSEAVGRWYWLERNVLKDVKRNPSQPRSRYVNDAEYESCKASAPARVRLAMELALLTGQRQGDIIAMGTALKASASGGSAVQNVNLTELGGPIEVTISGIGTLSNPVEMR